MMRQHRQVAVHFTVNLKTFHHIAAISFQSAIEIMQAYTAK